jgi:hypothetical protein
VLGKAGGGGHASPPFFIVSLMSSTLVEGHVQDMSCK